MIIHQQYVGTALTGGTARVGDIRTTGVALFGVQDTVGDTLIMDTMDGATHTTMEGIIIISTTLTTEIHTTDTHLAEAEETQITITVDHL